jgi:hypothetical protein
VMVAVMSDHPGFRIIGLYYCFYLAYFSVSKYKKVGLLGCHTLYVWVPLSVSEPDIFIDLTSQEDFIQPLITVRWERNF